MTLQVNSQGWNDLVTELKALEAFFQTPEKTTGERDELAEEVTELEELIAAAGIPEDEISRGALRLRRSQLAKAVSRIPRMS